MLETVKNRSSGAVGINVAGPLDLSFVLTGVGSTDGLYKSIDLGKTWVKKQAITVIFVSICCSDTGEKCYASGGGYIYVSGDFGETWSKKTPFTVANNGYSIACASDGATAYCFVADNTARGIYKSVDSGANWSRIIGGAAGTDTYGGACSTDGQVVLAGYYGGKLQVSTDGGTNFAAKESNRNWQSMAMSRDGVYQLASVAAGNVYQSTDSGANWALTFTGASTRCGFSVDGKLWFICTATRVYISDDLGISWRVLAPTMTTIGGGRIQTFNNKNLVITSTSNFLFTNDPLKLTLP